MLAIKLSRRGQKKAPTYRILVMEHTKDPWGDFLENVGHYNPQSDPKELVLKADRIKHWISKGAQPTDSVHNLLVSEGIIEGKKRNVSRLGSKAKAAAKAEKEASAAKAMEAAKAKAAPKEEAAPEGDTPVEKPAEEAPKEKPKAEEKPAEETPSPSAEATGDAKAKEEAKPE